MKASLVLCALCTMLLSSLSWADSYVVAPTGKDTNKGTPSAPWLTIQKAANTMGAGDTVTVQPGTYDEQVTITRNGAANMRMTFTANPVAKVLKGFIVKGNYVVIEGFDITNGGGTPFTANGVYLSGNFNIVQNNYIHDLRYQGIRIGDESDDFTHNTNIVRNNKIYKAATCGIVVGGRNNLVESNDISHTLQHPPGGDILKSTDADAIRFFGSANIIRANHIHDMSCTEPGTINAHIDCFQTWGPAYNIIIEQNFCDNPETYVGPDGCQPHAGMIHNAGVHDLRIRNNIFKVQVGLFIFDAPKTILVNNTFISRETNEGKWGLGVQLKNSPNSVVQNNIFYNVGQGTKAYLTIDAASLVGSEIGYNAHYMSTGKPPPGKHYPNDIWQQDPKFVDISKDDYHVKPTSPMIRQGLARSEVVNDYDNVARPQEEQYTIGAFAFVAPGGALPTAPSQLESAPQ